MKNWKSEFQINYHVNFLMEDATMITKHEGIVIEAENEKQFQDLVKIKDLDNRSINSLLQEGARLVRNQYVEQIAQERKTRTTLQNRYATLR